MGSWLVLVKRVPVAAWEGDWRLKGQSTGSDRVPLCFDEVGRARQAWQAKAGQGRSVPGAKVLASEWVTMAQSLVAVAVGRYWTEAEGPEDWRNVAHENPRSTISAPYWQSRDCAGNQPPQLCRRLKLITTQVEPTED